MKTNKTTTRDIIVYCSKYIKGKTLDFGAGNAKYKNIIKPQTSEYVTFDVIPGKNINIVGDALNSPFLDKSFDTIVSTQVLEHIEKPWLMVKEIGRILNHNGICILSAPFLVPYHADPNDYFRYTKNGLLSLFKNEGFEVLECESYGKVFTVFSEILHFTFLNPYNGKEFKGKQRIVKMVSSFFSYFDKFSSNQIVYPNVYIIARKK